MTSLALALVMALPPAAGADAGTGTSTSGGTSTSSGPSEWHAAVSLSRPRTGHTATLLPDGRVLVAGGRTDLGLAGPAELIDGDSRKVGGNMIEPRTGHTATLLPSGDVMVVGGRGADGDPIDLVEVYDSDGDTWLPAPPLRLPRSDHTATLLGDGSLLVSGGSTLVGPTQLVERHVNGEWQLSRPMGVPRSHHSATLLDDGTVLVAGGRGTLGTEASTESFDPGTGSWTSGRPMTGARRTHTATRLGAQECLQFPQAHCGDVVVVGGDDGSELVAVTEVYDAGTGEWRDGPTLGKPRRGHTATLLRDGKVVIAGGAGVPGPLVNTELFDPFGGPFTEGDAMTTGRSGHSATMLDDGDVLAVGGTDAGSTPLTSSERYGPGSALAISNLAPSGGPVAGGTSVTITGTGFTGARSVRFGDAPAASFSVVDGSTILAVSPPHAAGLVAVVVTTATATSATSVSPSYAYYDVPGTVSGLSAGAQSASVVQLTIPSASDGTGTLRRATEYVVKQSTARLNEANFDAAASLCGGVCSFGEQAAQYSLTITGLRPGTTYYYAVKAVSPGGTGAMSNVAKARTPRA
ncbi:MAG TPA: kelch repeat-containing protein [Acidimicrobiales bacterium]|nr:kelch repeat-containing protein [Acidimicrobiales bacterium]